MMIRNAGNDDDAPDVSYPPPMYEKRKPKWNWREFLTADEKAILDAADGARDAWQKLNRQRAGITNRAIQRAKYAALQRS